ncbi:MAG: MFS transporter [Paracoccaceae bacterium]
MAEVSANKRVWGWMMFDLASQPYNTLLLTFIFGPYFASVVADSFVASGMDADAANARTQSIWSLGLTIAGVLVALCAPLLGAMADISGRRMPWIYFFSVCYVAGAACLWWMVPDASNMTIMLAAFILGFVGMEFATIFTNAMLPELVSKDQIGRISGSGFAFGYWGGLVSLFIILLFFAENDSGKTLIGLAPLFGLDAVMREGTRFVGPFSAVWYLIFITVFFYWVREVPKPSKTAATVGQALADLGQTIKNLPKNSSLLSYLGSSLFYRDALNGLYGFGGVYATLVLNWSITSIGIFGIVGGLAAAIFSWLGGKADRIFGPKPVIILCIFALIIVCTIIVGMSRISFFGLPLVENSPLPDIVFFICGGVIGAAGGALQAASRTMMVRHAHPDRTTEAFGLYALSGKATSFLAPALIGAVTFATGSARLGVSPLIGLFVLGLVLLIWVKPDPESMA